ncbi:AlpA family transcriptional regulator [Pseudomonas fragi]|uniref:Helix-turn-helix transcriptional regulator n=1 Tax=Pseudomonas sp. WC2401 TaxID=3234143 RepID=A0AB39WYF5_9PSED|nr:AlpA family transcriptional regulator [Pseudomonas fragi]
MGLKLDRFIREKDVLGLTSLSRTTLWREVKRGRFPKPIAISAGRVGWRESALAAWQLNPEQWKAPETTEAA